MPLLTNMLISASAGTGKTYQLSLRFLGLLALNGGNGWGARPLARRSGGMEGGKPASGTLPPFTAHSGAEFGAAQPLHH